MTPPVSVESLTSSPSAWTRGDPPARAVRWSTGNHEHGPQLVSRHTDVCPHNGTVLGKKKNAVLRHDSSDELVQGITE